VQNLGFVEFHVDPVIWDRFPGLRLVCLASDGLDNSMPNLTVDSVYQSSQANAAPFLQSVDLESFPPFAVWRHAQPGAAYPAAHESLGRRVAGGKPLRPISPLVDAYNAISLNLLTRGIAVPVGAWDATELPIIRLGVTTGGEPFKELGKKDAVFAEAGEVAYIHVPSNELVTRHFVWRQSVRGAITPATTAFFMVSELIPPFSDQVQLVVDSLTNMCEQLLSVGVHNKVLQVGDLGCSMTTR